jgi:protein disulfide-isomerase
MKKVLFILLFVMGTIGANAQDLKWHTNMAEAIKLSEKQNKPLFMFFTGSDWCGWCIRLQREVLKTPEFAAWAEKNVILVELDFPRKTAQAAELKSQNMQLAQTFQVRGYPTVWIANATKNKEGKINFSALGNTGYVAGGPSAWLKVADDIMAKNPKK